MSNTNQDHLDNLRVRLREQIENLEVSAARYDAGGTSEGNRLAVTVRVLVHDTSRSVSLFRQMGVRPFVEQGIPGQLQPLVVSKRLQPRRYKAGVHENRQRQWFRALR